MALIASAWKLAIITRCDAFRACLSAPEHALVESLDVQQYGCLKAAESEQNGGKESWGTTRDTHLERYKKWKLDDDKIDELTSVREDEGSVLHKVTPLVTDLRFFARGKRGVLYAAETIDQGDPVVVKFAGDPRASTSSAVIAGCWVETEAKWIRVMNRMGIGARLVASGTGWLICERLEGHNIVEFLTETATNATVRWVLREMLCQCFTMDMMGVNKEEMTHPTRHIIVHIARSAPQRWQCTFIDFEKCQYTKKPKNVTQLCQFLSSPRMTGLFERHGITWDVQQLRQRTKQYKQSITAESFGGLMKVFQL
ncbi:hypothetical protein Poli38472_009770 [Pythium oligandrum]|uniref:Uncharacterized protein n=1 Tax=Pythium oligandrum TaxID=41045 RepID=A0A8K1CHL1_PYTOL|nr:hypothetical protein Poli38472_009770 [Pythium oligandrum]|eukprot:TMW62277.1 hypothetical protein Poli38472_009770 [Pythium oligandrum]